MNTNRIYLPVPKIMGTQLLNHHQGILSQSEDPDGRRFTSIYVTQDNLNLARKEPDIAKWIPWQHRAKRPGLPIQATPRLSNINILQEVLSSQSYQFLSMRIHAARGGRCEVCGAHHENRVGRRIPTNIIPVIRYLPHDNPDVKRGIAVIRGLLTICDDCLTMISLADFVPCKFRTPKDREDACRDGLIRLAKYLNADTGYAESLVTKRAGSRKPTDDHHWAYNVAWLEKSGALPANKMRLSLYAENTGYRMKGASLIVPPAIALSEREKIARAESRVMSFGGFQGSGHPLPESPGAIRRIR